MTTIAFDGETLASDGLATFNEGIIADYSFKKIYDTSGFSERFAAVGVSGSVHAVDAVLQCARQGGPEGIATQGMDFHAVLIDYEGNTYTWSGGNYLWKYKSFNKKGVVAVGSGEDIAIGALEFGATAEEAVQIASQHDVYSGGEVVTIKVAKSPNIKTSLISRIKKLIKK